MNVVVLFTYLVVCVIHHAFHRSRSLRDKLVNHHRCRQHAATRECLECIAHRVVVVEHEQTAFVTSCARSYVVQVRGRQQGAHGRHGTCFCFLCVMTGRENFWDFCGILGFHNVQNPKLFTHLERLESDFPPSKPTPSRFTTIYFPD